MPFANGILYTASINDLEEEVVEVLTFF